MTAVLMGTLVEEGVLDWSTTLQDVFGSDVSIQEDYQSVTMEMLLSHRAGTWGSFAEHRDTWQMMWADGDVMEQRQSVVEDVLSEEPEVPPGSTYLYSNAGYVIAGASLERLTGTSWETLMNNRLFGPLEMDSCGFGAPDSTGGLEHPWGHNGNSPVNPAEGVADNPPSLGPAGTVHCNLEDWASFIIDVLQGPKGNGALLSNRAV